jgi:hypothetical protein
MDLKELVIGCFFERSIRTSDRKLHLAQPEFVEALREAVNDTARPCASAPSSL